MLNSCQAVAVAATCSWLCCIVLLSWISYLLYGMYRKHQSETTSRYAFLRTQCEKNVPLPCANLMLTSLYAVGMLFANLLVADLMQSTAFGLNYYWFFTKKRPQANVSHVCAVQAIGIQSGDLASAIWVSRSTPFCYGISTARADIIVHYNSPSSSPFTPSLSWSGDTRYRTRLLSRPYPLCGL